MEMRIAESFKYTTEEKFDKLITKFDAGFLNKRSNIMEHQDHETIDSSVFGIVFIIYKKF